MSVFGALVLLATSLALLAAPWHRQGWQKPRTGLALDAAAVVAAVLAACWVSRRFVPAPEIEDWSRVALVAAGYCYAVFGGVGIVRLVLGLVPVQPAGSGEVLVVTAVEQSRGRIIGMLERAIAVTLMLYGEFGALGMIVAAKAVARFRGLEDRDFAEYFLIGTLSSLLVAVVAAAGVMLLR